MVHISYQTLRTWEYARLGRLQKLSFWGKTSRRTNKYKNPRLFGQSEQSQCRLNKNKNPYIHTLTDPSVWLLSTDSHTEICARVGASCSVKVLGWNLVSCRSSKGLEFIYSDEGRGIDSYSPINLHRRDSWSGGNYVEIYQFQWIHAEHNEKQQDRDV